MEIGLRIKKLRLQRGLTIRQLALKAGCSTGFLCKLELNQTSPVLSNLEKVCAALKIPVIDLLREEPLLAEPICVSQATEQKSVAMFWHRVQMQHLLPASTPTTITALQLVMEPRSSTPFRCAKRAMKELAIVLSGEVSLVINDRKYSLKGKDAIYFDLREKHQWSNELDIQANVFLFHPNKFRLFEQEEEDAQWEHRKNLDKAQGRS